MQQQFLLQPLIDQNHAITPISQTVQLYNTKMKLTHAVEGVRIMLTPCEPFLKHSKPLVGAGTWALRYKDKIHDKTPAIIKGNDLVIFTNAKDAPSMLETIANIAKFHHDLHTIMDKVIINTVKSIVFGRKLRI